MLQETRVPAGLPAQSPSDAALDEQISALEQQISALPDKRHRLGLCVKQKTYVSYNMGSFEEIIGQVGRRLGSEPTSPGPYVLLMLTSPGPSSLALYGRRTTSRSSLSR